MEINGGPKNFTARLKSSPGVVTRFWQDGREMTVHDLSDFIRNGFGIDIATSTVSTRDDGRFPSTSLTSLPAQVPARPSLPVQSPLDDTFVAFGLQTESQHVNALKHQLEQLQPTDSCVEEARILHELGRHLIAAQGYASSEVQAVYTRARRLLQYIDDDKEYIRTVWGIWAYYAVSGQLDRAEETGRLLLQHSTALNQGGGLLRAHNVLLATYGYRGDLDQALTHLMEARRYLANQETWSPETPSYDENVEVSLHSNAAWALWAAGRDADACHAADTAILLATRTSNSFTLAHALYFAARLHHLRRDPAAARDAARKTLELSKEESFPLWWAGAAIVAGDLRSQEGDHDNGLELVQEGMRVWEAIGARISAPYGHLTLAQCLGRRGDLLDAIAEVDKALRLISVMNCRFHESQAHCVRAELQALASGNGHVGLDADTENSLLHAIELARVRRARSFELRARISYARVLAAEHHSMEAHRTVAAGLRHFSPHDSSPDLSEARSFLDRLGASNMPSP
ncbi:MAG: hypothetical protein FLDDKLPJ_03335 [Phycisphaerae bacterium]|nr:hypothetical protein [Phycisphaerae bacterium]